MAADRSVLVRLRAHVTDYVRDLGTAEAATTSFERRLQAAERQGGSSIDRLSGRIGLLTDALLTVGPAAIPLGGAVAAGIGTLASSAGFAAVAAGSMAVAWGGVGDALEAVNKAHLEPTTENLEEAEKLLKRLAPEARDFIEQLDSMRGLGGRLRDAGAGALFPGLTEALETLESRGPDAQRVLVAINETVGQIAAEGAASLASERWDDFFQMLEDEGPRTLDATADAIGNVVHGASEMWEAFAPLNRDGMDWIVEATEDFDKWAQGLEDSKGFKAFTRYIRRNGPQLQETLGSIGDAAVEIVEAAAPLGGPSLRALESFADIVARIADTDFATPLLAAVAAMRAINRLAPGAASGLGLVAVGGAGGKGGKPGAGGTPPVVVPGAGDKNAPRGTPRAPRRGPTAGGAFATWLGIDLLTDELGWKEASKVQEQNAKTFFEEYGATVSEQAEKARVKLSKTLDVSTGSGPFGLMENDEGLSNTLALEPIEEQIELQKHLRRQYGLSYKDLERQGVLVRGFTKDFRAQREAVDPLAKDIERLGNMKAKPEVDLDDKGARRKAKENDDWINRWGRRNEKAEVGADNRRGKKAIDEAEDLLRGWGRTEAAGKVDADNRGARKGINDASGWLQSWGRSSGAATVDAITASAQRKMEQVAATLRGLDGDVAYTQVITEYKVVRSSVDAIAPRGRADGGTVPDDGGPYSDRFLFALAPREEIVSDRYGGASKNRSALKAASRGATLAVVGYADGGTAGRRPDLQAAASTFRTVDSRAAVQVSLAGLTFRADVDGLGEVMFRVAEEVQGDRRAHDQARRATIYTGVGSD